MKLQEVRIKSAREQLERYHGLAGAKKFVSEALVKQKQDEVTDQEIKLQTLRRQRGQVDRDLASARMDEPAIQMSSRAQVEQVSRQISELQEGMAQNESKRETVIRAPMAGIVTNIAVNQGQSIAADSPFAVVLPKGTGMGVAFHYSHAGYFAEVVQATVAPATGAIKIDKVWVAADVGRQIVNPAGAMNQVQGAALEGLSHALYQKITIVDGAAAIRSSG